MNRLMEKKAVEFRQQNGFSSSEPIDPTTILLSKGVNALFQPLSKDFSGVSIKTDNDMFTMINTAQSIGRQNFTIAHELYHLLIQEDFFYQKCNVGKFAKKDEHEYNADCFAAYLLMPEDGIISKIPENELSEKKSRITLKTVIQLEQYFRVSRLAILTRLLDLKLIDRPLFDEYRMGVIRSAKNYGYDDSIYIKTNAVKFLGSYGELAKSLFDQEKISESHYLSLMMDIGIDLSKDELDED